MTIEKRLERVEAILDARGLDWDHPRVENADDPAEKSEPEHPAGPKPEPGEGYRILSKDPLEELQDDDECQGFDGVWFASGNAQMRRQQEPCLWYRRKIEPPEPEYREPVLPADGGMECEFSEEGDFWSSGRLGGVRIGRGWFSTGGVCWRHCRIKKDA